MRCVIPITCLAESHMREDDLWPCFSSSRRRGLVKERVRKTLDQAADCYLLTKNVRRLFVCRRRDRSDAALAGVEEHRAVSAATASGLIAGDEYVTTCLASRA